MLKGKLKIALILFLAIILVSGLSFATAETTSQDITAISETSEEEVISTTDDSWVKNDLYICEDTVVVDDIVDGNAFIIGKDVTIKGEIGGDLFVLAQNLNIDGGYVYSSIFACANDMTINGIVYDVYALANNFTLGENGFIYRDLKVSGDNINIDGRIKRDAYLYGSNYNITDTALVGGNLQYTANEDINIPENIITGDVTRNIEKSVEKVESIGSIISSYIVDLLKTILYTFVIVVLLLWLAPKFVDRVGQMSIAKDFTSLGIGLAAFASVLVGSIILMITVIGLPLAISSIVLLIVLASISFSITSIFFGKLFSTLLKLEGNVKFVLITLASSIVLWIICQTPILGALAKVLITLFGVGSVITNIVYKKDAKETK